MVLFSVLFPCGFSSSCLLRFKRNGSANARRKKKVAPTKKRRWKKVGSTQPKRSVGDPEGARRRQHHTRGENSTPPKKDAKGAPPKAAPPTRGQKQKQHHPGGERMLAAPKKEEEIQQHHPKGSEGGTQRRREEESGTGGRRRQHHPRGQSKHTKEGCQCSTTQSSTPQTRRANHFTFMFFSSLHQLQHLLSFQRKRWDGSTTPRRRRKAAPPKTRRREAAPPTWVRDKAGITQKRWGERDPTPFLPDGCRFGVVAMCVCSFSKFVASCNCSLFNAWLKNEQFKDSTNFKNELCQDATTVKK